jgi:hypothetical protein
MLLLTFHPVFVLLSKVTEFFFNVNYGLGTQQINCCLVENYFLALIISDNKSNVKEIFLNEVYLPLITTDKNKFPVCLIK